MQLSLQVVDVLHELRCAVQPRLFLAPPLRLSAPQRSLQASQAGDDGRVGGEAVHTVHTGGRGRRSSKKRGRSSCSGGGRPWERSGEVD